MWQEFRFRERHIQTGVAVHTLFADTRQAFRSLVADRRFSLIALLTVAVGVGVNTAVFSVVNAVLIRDLPYADSSRIVALHETLASAPGERYQVSYPNFQDWQREARTFESMAAYADEAFMVQIGDSFERVDGPQVSWNYFDILGVRPQLGRTFLPEEDLATAARVVILSDGRGGARSAATSVSSVARSGSIASRRPSSGSCRLASRVRRTREDCEPTRSCGYQPAGHASARAAGRGSIRYWRASATE